MAEPHWTIRTSSVVVAQPATPRIQVLRLRQPGETTLNVLAHALGNRLPQQANRAVGQYPRLYCLAPGDWMIVHGDGRDAPELSLATAELGHLADVMAGRAVFTVTGTGARDLLAAGTSLDLHPRAFPDGAMGQTLFAQIRVLLERVGTDGFRLFADISFVAHLRHWFEDAIR